MFDPWLFGLLSSPAQCGGREVVEVLAVGIDPVGVDDQHSADGQCGDVAAAEEAARVQVRVGAGNDVLERIDLTALGVLDIIEPVVVDGDELEGVLAEIIDVVHGSGLEAGDEDHALRFGGVDDIRDGTIASNGQGPDLLVVGRLIGPALPSNGSTAALWSDDHADIGVGDQVIDTMDGRVLVAHQLGVFVVQWGDTLQREFGCWIG